MNGNKFIQIKPTVPLRNLFRGSLEIFYVIHAQSLVKIQCTGKRIVVPIKELMETTHCWSRGRCI